MSDHDAPRSGASDLVEQQLDAAQRLQEVSAALIDADDVQTLYQRLLDTAMVIMRSEFGSIQTFHRERGASGELRLLAHRGFTPEAAAFWAWVRPSSRSPCGEALRTGKRVVVPDATTCDFMAGSEDLSMFLETGIRACQTTPLRCRLGGEVIGMISTHWREVHEPTQGELRMLDLLARQAADVIDRKRVEEELREANRRKDEFIGMLSHELRNPLAPIRNSIYILRHADPAGDQARQAQLVIERQTDHLTRLVDDLLDVTRIARGKVELRRSRVDLRDVVLRAATDFRAVMHGRGVTLHVAALGPRTWADVDATRITQVVGNLLHNAAKFAGHGSDVTLELRATGDQAEISVRDTGAGIDPALLPKLFEPFVQGDGTLARTEGGLGLGLALVKGITELHGGTVHAESAGPGKGAEFRVRLPLAAAKGVEGRRNSNVRSGNGGRRVLVVDDNRDAAESLAEIVRMLGHEAEVAYDGPSAIERARAHRPDVVLCDIGLPGVSGYDVAKALRGDGLGRVRLVAVSGYAQPEDQSASLDAGFDRHIAKPASVEDIEQLLG